MNPPRLRLALLVIGLLAPVAALPAADVPSLPKAPAALELVNGYLKVGFDRLAGFKFVPPAFDPVATPGAQPPSVANQIPDAIKQLDGQKTLVTGYMLPVKMEAGLVTEFMLVSSPAMCCYGTTPNMNEWVVVKMPKGGGVKALMDIPVSLYGRLQVKGLYDNGYLTGIYFLEGEKLADSRG